MTKALHVGFIGTGLMGKPMCQRLLRQGYQLSVWNRTRYKLHDLEKEGAVAMDTPEALAKVCDVICLCLMDAKAVETVVFGEYGAASGMQPSQVLIDFSSIGAEATRRLAMRLHEDVQGAWIDAPVSGGVEGAGNGTLSIFVGGDEACIESVAPIFSTVGSKVMHLGPIGAGQVAKSCNQIIVGCNFVLIAEMIATARKAGLNVEKLPEAMAGSWSDSRPLQILGPRMAARVTEPKIGALGTMLKDLYEVVGLARSSGASVPITSMMAELYRICGQHVESGLDADVSSLINLYEGNDPLK